MNSEKYFNKLYYIYVDEKNSVYNRTLDHRLWFRKLNINQLSYKESQIIIKIIWYIYGAQ